MDSSGKSSSQENSYSDTNFSSLSLPKKKKKKIEENSPSKNLQHRRKVQQNYYNRNREKILKKKRDRYQKMSVEKKELKLDNARKRYQSMPKTIKSNLSVKNAKKYASLSAVEKKNYIENVQSRVGNKLIETYLSEIKDGPTYICVCCGGLWFKKQMKIVNNEFFANGFTDEFISQISCVPHVSTHQLCRYCHRYIQNQTVPPLCLSNGLDFQDAPSELAPLTNAEERLLSPRLPFMQIKQLGFERQNGLKGQIVNVPIDVKTNVEVIPRDLSDTYTIQLHLKRKMEYKHDYICEMFRPGLVLKWAKFLAGTELYREMNIGLAENWKKYEGFDDDFEEMFVVSPEDLDVAKRMHSNLKVKNCRDYEFDDTLNPGGNETLLNNVAIDSITLAPGEGKIPLSIILDEYAEELAFCSIHLGQKRKLKVNLTYKQIVKSALRHYKRQSARVDKLFFMYKKDELLKLSSNVSICLRKKFIKSNQITASQVIDSNYIETLLQHDDGYRLFENMSSSPAYWLKEGKEIRAMIRQLGIPSFFITLSSAETKWNELLVILHEVVYKKPITAEEAANLPFAVKANLIRSDPVTCARYFDHRLRLLLNIIKHQNGFFSKNKYLHHYWRVEVQQRGSLHLHCLFWFQDIPTFEREDNKTEAAVIQCIDNYITTNIDLLSRDDLRLLNNIIYSFTIILISIKCL